MADVSDMSKVLEGLWHDPETGNYKLKPGYGHEMHWFRIHETWLDEDDNLWIDGAAVERLAKEGLKSEPATLSA